MTKKRLRTLKKQLRLKGSAAKAAEALARDGSPEAVRVLAKAVTQSHDQVIVDIASKAIRQLTNQECINEVCSVWAKTHHPTLADILIKHGWGAFAPIELKVLSAMKTGKRDTVVGDGAEVIEPLLHACDDADEQIRQTAQECLRHLHNPDAIDAFCGHWLQHRTPLLTKILMHAGYVARHPINARIFSALQTGQLQVVKEGDAEVFEPLLQACDDPDETIRHNARECVKHLQDPETIDALCARWVEKRESLLREAIIQAKYVARAPVKVSILSTLLAGEDFKIDTETRHCIEILLQACHDADGTIATRAQQVLKTLKTQQAREVLCQKAIEHDDPVVHKIVKTAQYTPQDPAQRALFYFLTEQWGKYEHLDVDQRLFKTLYPYLDADTQKRLTARARKAGRLEWVEMVVRTRQKKQFAEMTDEDWGTILTLLSTRQAWHKMWRLAGIAPAGWSVRLLNRLRDAQWTPEHEAERAVFEQMGELAQDCQHEPGENSSNVVEYSAELQGHTGAVHCLAMSLDGRLLASGSTDKMVRVWRLPEGETVQTLEGHTRPINCLAMSSDGRLLASGDGHTVRLWRLPEGEKVRILSEYTTSFEHTSSYKITCFAMSSDGRLLASGSWRTVRLWRLPEGETVRRLTGHTGPVNCLAMSPDGRLLASGGKDGMVRVWRLPEGDAIQTLRKPSHYITSQYFVYDTDPVRMQKLRGHNHYITCLAMSPDGRLLASGSKDDTVRLWRLPEGEAVRPLYGHANKITCLAMSPDGRLLASGSTDKTVRVWRLPEGEALRTLQGHTGPVNCLAISPDGRLLASGSRDGMVRLWQLWKLKLKHLTILPVSQITQHDITWLQKTLQEPDLTDGERAWLEFTLKLIHWQRRFDIEVGEVPRRIQVGEFDIELEG